MKENEDFVDTLSAWVRNAVVLTLVALSAVLAGGCTRRVPSAPPVVMTRTVLESDSVVGRLLEMLVSARTSERRDSFVRTELRTERVTVNERGDTLRTDTRTEVATARYRELERENRVLLARIDSLRATSARVDSVPVPVEVRVPCPVERDLTAWERVRLGTWWWLVAGLVAGFVWAWLRMSRC